MDRRERTLNVVTALNAFTKGSLANFRLVDEVCEFFDFMKDEELDDSDKRFLLFLSNRAGIPQYYDILDKFNKKLELAIEDENIGLNTFCSLLYEAGLYTDGESKLHQYQMEILNLFTPSKQNRFFLSASTSFGKTHLVYEVIKKLKYKNVALIFPSIALLTENLSKIKEGRIKFPVDYHIHTLSDLDNDYGENNLFIFTPERFLSFLDKNIVLKLDFIFVDEVYKIDNGYIIDDEARENERDVAYRMAIFYGITKFSSTDILLAGPYIEIFDDNAPAYNPSFDLFLQDFQITKLLRNEFEIVKVSKNQVDDAKGRVQIDDIEFDFSKKLTKRAKIQEILSQLILRQENAIVYCNTQSNAEKVALQFEKNKISLVQFQTFIDHLKNKFDSTWVVIEALEKGVGVHHGVVPKYIQKEIVSLFNAHETGVKVLVSTTTITEGVNTTAKNMVVYKSEKGGGKYGKPLLAFDAKNIAGRAGRFMEHYKGRLITLDKEFLKVIEEKGEQIKHKNYDINIPKLEIDDDMTPDRFLDNRSRERLHEVYNMQLEREIPEAIISQFKVISRRDKIKIYDKICKLPSHYLSRIKKMVGKLNSPAMGLDKDGFQVILDLIFEQIENEGLKALIENKFDDRYSNNRYSILFASLNSYLQTGFSGVYGYLLKKEKAKEHRLAVNSAMRKASSLIFNTYKYQLVKYLGVFNLMYRFWLSKNDMVLYEDTSGIDKLLIKLEYNAFSEEARIASDYGVPQKIIDYYDSASVAQGNQILDSFDSYEREIYDRVRRIIEE